MIYRIALIAFAVTRAEAFCWSCNDHGSWSWFSCTCEQNYGGQCCDDFVGGCTSDMEEMCPQSQMAEQTHQCESVDKSGPLRVGTAPLPPQLRGVFWLAEQGDSSALMSFAKSNDGAGLSQGFLARRPEDGYNYKIRVGGDRTWSFHDKASSWGLVEALDLIYNFRMDNATDPTSAQIIPSGSNLGGLTLDASWLLDFQMKLLANHSRYPNSMVWGRPSRVLGFEGGYYDLIQVMNEKGDKLQPAFDDWVGYCKSSATGDTPGQLWYRRSADTN